MIFLLKFTEGSNFSTKVTGDLKKRNDLLVKHLLVKLQKYILQYLIFLSCGPIIYQALLSLISLSKLVPKSLISNFLLTSSIYSSSFFKALSKH